MSEYVVDYESVPLKWRDGYGLSDIDLTEEVVRCRDCKYLDTPDWDEVLAAQHGEPPASCMRPDGNGDYMRFEIEPDGFCKWGEVKEEPCR